MYRICPALDIKIEYGRPPKDLEEEYYRNHIQNTFNRIAYTYFNQGTPLEDLKRYIATELLLDGDALPESVKWKL